MDDLYELYQDAQKDYGGTELMLCRDENERAVIIGYSSGVNLSKVEIPDKYDGQLRIKHPQNVSNEAMNASMYVLNEQRKLGTEQKDMLQSCIRRHSSRLWKAHSNLTIISADCVKYIGGRPVDKDCIVLYCLSKGLIPFGEDRFPKYLQENRKKIEVDVREGYFQFGPNDRFGLVNSFNDPVCMGSSIGSENNGKTGSVGFFVNLPNNKVGFVTCCHVLYDCIHSSNSFHYQADQNTHFTIQPSSAAVCGKAIEEKRCGMVKKAVFKPETDPVSVDAALVQMTKRIPNTGLFSISVYTQITEAGYALQNPPIYSGGKILRSISKKDREKPLIKSGTTTGLTKGEFKMNGLEVSITKEGVLLGDMTCFPKRVMKGQYEVISSKTFFDPGDSGSAVFLKDPDGSLKCIGMAIGKTSFNTTIVTPIGAVLESLGLEEQDMMNFGVPMDET